jgi:hypothetical protein
VVGQVAQHRRVVVGDAREAAALPGFERVERRRRLLDHLEVTGRDRVAVRIVRRIPERRGNQLFELLGDVVLEHLGLVVDTIPRHAERLRQVQLEQPVMAQNLERDAPARLGQLHPVVRGMLDQAEPVELLDHVRGGRGRDAEPFGEGIVRDWAFALDLKRVDRLRVVLHRRRNRVLLGHKKSLAAAKQISSPQKG